MCSLSFHISFPWLLLVTISRYKVDLKLNIKIYGWKYANGMKPVMSLCYTRNAIIYSFSIIGQNVFLSRWILFSPLNDEFRNTCWYIDNVLLYSFALFYIFVRFQVRNISSAHNDTESHTKGEMIKKFFREIWASRCNYILIVNLLKLSELCCANYVALITSKPITKLTCST